MVTTYFGARKSCPLITTTIRSQDHRLLTGRLWVRVRLQILQILVIFGLEVAQKHVSNNYSTLFAF